MATATPGGRVDARGGARVLGDAGSRSVKRPGEKGLITPRALDGVRARFRRRGLGRPAENSVRPAPASAPPAA